MYTEDDEEVKVKNNNSNNNYNDFYTSFNAPEEKPKKEKKKPKKEKIIETSEEDYSDFYGSNDEEVTAPIDNGNKNIKPIIKVGIIVLLMIVIIVLLIAVLGKKNDTKVPGDIEISNSDINLKPGEKTYISYTIIGTESNVTSSFQSSNPSVVIVDSNGEVTAVRAGEATITVYYTIEGVTGEKKCNVKVEGPEIKHEISLSLKSSNSNWTNKDVTVTVNAKSDTAITSLKYAINCTSECSYNDVVDNKIVISNNGTTKITVVAKDQSNLESTKEVTVKIDKEAPTITFNQDKNIVSNKEVEVCATCSDNISGCKQGKVCKKYASSKSNQVITVTDNAGNSKNSPTFNVTIKKLVSPCTLSVSKDGVVSATLKESSTYYGFNSNYTGSNELSKQITINVSKKDEAKAKVVQYYVKNKNGNAGSCFITVIKECKCTDPNSTDNNCPVTCTYRAS